MYLKITICALGKKKRERKRSSVEKVRKVYYLLHLPPSCHSFHVPFTISESLIWRTLILRPRNSPSTTCVEVVRSLQFRHGSEEIRCL